MPLGPFARLRIRAPRPANCGWTFFCAAGILTEKGEGKDADMERWISLDGTWTLYFTDERRQAPRTPAELLALGAPCIPAQVPGNVELDLSRAGMLPEDLFQGMNPRKAEAFEPFGWWYAREFPAPESAADEHVFLRLDGVDCLAEYFLNGERIGASENAFMPHEFDVTDRLRPQNVLWVHIRSALLEQLSQPYAQYLLTGWHIDGGVALRKPAHSFGWDIFPRAVTAGLWKSVRLAVRDAYAFAELGYRVRFDRVQTPSLEFYFSVDAPLEKLAGQSLSVRVAGRCGADSSFFGQCALDRAKVGRIDCAVENPKLWWPYGYGEANVYDAVAELLDGWRPEPDPMGSEGVAGERRLCPCCGNYTLHMPIGSCELCPVCCWTDDSWAAEHPKEIGDYNEVPLETARRNYRIFSACTEALRDQTRPPEPEELPEVYLRIHETGS